MTPGESSDIVLGAMVGTFALAVVNDVRRKQTPRPRILIGALGAAVLLSAASQVAPQPAAALAVVVLLGTLFGAGGGATIDALAAAVSH